MDKAEGIDRASLGLIEVPSAIWRGVVWINLDGTAGAFDNWSAGVRARWRDASAPVLAHGRFTLDVACNWKLAVENYCESYHLPWVHPGLNAYSRLVDHSTIAEQGFAGEDTVAYSPGLRLAEWPALSKRWERGAEYVAMFPNVLLGQHRDHAFAIVLEPGASDRTEHVAIHYPEPPLPEAACRNADQWREVFEEDIAVVEGMQRGRHGATHAFHRWVAGRMA